MKLFMIDYLEFNLRRIMIDNTSFCSQRCHLFDDLMQPATESKAGERALFSCFEKCLGKFSDSYDSALDVFGSHLRSLNTSQVFRHSQAQNQEEAAL